MFVIIPILLVPTNSHPARSRRYVNSMAVATPPKLTDVSHSGVSNDFDA